ncbi:AMP-binding protein [Pseudonocardia endophytica]|uniref:Crotonobetaine/carnitine-CoA ligase n=1 Tax=Pseudonocardia endophytica TaxID=401976 RepID=A0A4R1HXX9_PSEEN|nr:AMP-binding protein [Pseudonocardia endophytica]TCK27637.1 crotonobetaine/carnitine-CoA ligase [Pseudonocardia endophytica]
MTELSAHDALPSAIARTAAQDPGRPFLLQVDGRSQNYGEADAEGDRFASAFRRLGVEQETRVLTLLPPCIDAVDTWVGLARLGAVNVPVNTSFEGRILEYVIENSRAGILVCAARWLDRITHLADRLTSLRVIVVLDGPPTDGLPQQILTRDEFLTGDPGDETFGNPELSDPAMIMYTSGTTGSSKGVVLPWGAFVRSSHNLVAPDCDVDSHDVMYLPFPMFHISGTQFLSIMARVGGTVVLREVFSTDDYWSDIRRFSCTISLMVGAMAGFLAKQDARPDDADNPLDVAIIIPMIDGQAEFERRFDVRTYTLYGSTELGCVLTSNLGIVPPRSCGFLRPGFELRIVDTQDRPVPDGEPGELIVRPTEPWTTIIEYFDMPAATAAAFRNLWFHTGDTFVRTPDGDYIFFDRLKDSIRRRGENISSAELEACVLVHDAVLECAAVAVPAEISEDEVKVCVVLRPGRELTAPELIDHLLTERVPRFMIPRYVEFLDTLPKTPTNKIQKDRLRAAGVTATTWQWSGRGSNTELVSSGG